MALVCALLPLALREDQKTRQLQASTVDKSTESLGPVTRMDELNISASTFQQLVESTTTWLTSAIQELKTGPTTYVDATHDCPDGYEAARALARR